jgi:hypothetical protein
MNFSCKIINDLHYFNFVTLRCIPNLYSSTLYIKYNINLIHVGKRIRRYHSYHLGGFGGGFGSGFNIQIGGTFLSIQAMDITTITTITVSTDGETWA